VCQHAELSEGKVSMTELLAADPRCLVGETRHPKPGEDGDGARPTPSPVTRFDVHVEVIARVVEIPFRDVP